MNAVGSVKEKLQKKIMLYRKTPNSTTGLSPRKMMYKRIYITKIDLVKRSEEIRNDSNDEKVVNKELRRGDQVQIRMYNSEK